MKKNLLYLLIVFFTLSITSCKDDDNTLPIEQKIAGTYKGTLDITMYANGDSEGTEIAKDSPQKVYLSKVDDNGIKMELKNFSVIGLDLGDISVDRSEIIENGGSYSFTGEQTLDLTAKGLGKCPVKVNGVVTDSKIVLNIDVTVTELSQIVKVKFTGNKMTGTESSEAKITAFTFDKSVAANSVVGTQPVINGTTISFTVADSAKPEDIIALVPTITVSEKATITPGSGIAQDFSQVVKYTVIAEDGTQQEYTVMIGGIFYDFEVWTVVNPTAKPELQYTSAAGWADCNPAVQLIKSMGASSIGYTGPFPVNSTTEAYSGKFAANLVSIDTKGGKMLGQTVPKVTAATIFLGKFNAMAAIGGAMKATEFGILYDKKPLSVKGYFKYTPGSEFYEGTTLTEGKKDECALCAVLYEVVKESDKLDGSNIYTSDKIVAMKQFFSGEVKEYTPFELKLDYNKEYQADKLYKFTVIFSASKDGAAYNAAVGSHLIVDDVEIVNE